MTYWLLVLHLLIGDQTFDVVPHKAFSVIRSDCEALRRDAAKRTQDPARLECVRVVVLHNGKIEQSF